MGLVPADVIAEATSAIRKTERIEDQQARRDAYEAAEEKRAAAAEMDPSTTVTMPNRAASMYAPAIAASSKPPMQRKASRACSRVSSPPSCSAALATAC